MERRFALLIVACVPRGALIHLSEHERCGSRRRGTHTVWVEHKQFAHEGAAQRAQTLLAGSPALCRRAAQPDPKVIQCWKAVWVANERTRLSRTRTQQRVPAERLDQGFFTGENHEQAFPVYRCDIFQPPAERWRWASGASLVARYNSNAFC